MISFSTLLAKSVLSFLMSGIGGKNVGIPYDTLSFKGETDGTRVIRAPLSLDKLEVALTFKAIKNTTHHSMKDKAIALGKSALKKAGQLKDQLMKKI
jgi:hypothetical protein